MGLERVLHVTECHAGGVSRAIRTAVELLPEYEHHLLWSGAEEPESGGAFETVQRLPERVSDRISAVREQTELVRPGAVHAHSSWAGFYTRLTNLKVPIIYQPHCYKFDDPGLGRLSRSAFYLAEKILMLNTKVVVVLSPHENRLAKKLRSSVSRSFVPNVPTVVSPSEHATRMKTPNEVIMIGRISAQKDPAYFTAVAEAIRRKTDSFSFTWVGDGDIASKERLQGAGINVTGWLSKLELSEILSRPAVYLHTAKYEGFPLSVLDAAEFGLPIIARRIPAFEGTPLSLVNSPEDAANLVLSVANDEAQWTKNRESSKRLLGLMNIEAQRNALREMYASATERLTV